MNKTSKKKKNLRKNFPLPLLYIYNNLIPILRIQNQVLEKKKTLYQKILLAPVV